MLSYMVAFCLSVGDAVAVVCSHVSLEEEGKKDSLRVVTEIDF